MALFIILLLIIIFSWMNLNFVERKIQSPHFFHSLPNSMVPDQYEQAAFIEWPPLQKYSPSNYPKYRPLLEILESWNPDIADQPDRFVETLQHFNYSDPHERRIAETYRDAEVPFKVYDVPEFEKARLKWTKSYLTDRLSGKKCRVEKSKNNHFMYWTKRNSFKRSSEYVPPTDVIDMTFDQWSSVAERADVMRISNSSEHFYFMADDHIAPFVREDLPLFSSSTPNFFIVNPDANKGIQCRFGMRGIISESHYDSGRNMVAMVTGRKRYILTPPSSCRYLGIISDKKHPSFRHSVIDWSDLQQGRAHSFDRVDGIDTIVRPGEVLYIPSFWFHYITSLQYSIQCNSRSGFPKNFDGAEHIEKADCINQPIAQRKGLKKRAVRGKIRRHARIHE